MSHQDDDLERFERRAARRVERLAEHPPAGIDPADWRRGIAHSLRFRRVSTRYPLRVTEAYEGDIARAAGDSDEEVAAAVARWEEARWGEPVDWHAIGREEQTDD